MQRQTNGRIIIDILQIHLNTLNAVFENMSRALELDIQRLRLGVIKKSSDSYRARKSELIPCIHITHQIKKMGSFEKHTTVV